MQQLHVLGVSEDGTAVVLSGPPGSDLGPFQVPRDERLRAAALGRRLDEDAPTILSTLPPREIQARLRAGVAAADVAAEAGIAVDKVLRYDGPIQAERARVVDDARAATVTGSAGDPKAVRLGAAVEAALRGNLSWDSWRREDGTWTVEVRHEAGRAQWRWDGVRRRVDPLDDAARRVVQGEPEPTPPATEPPPEAVSARAPSRGRASVPAWDDIVFGTGRPGPGEPDSPVHPT
ncbi:MAG: septation protein SepH [Actinomycetota bacterium]|nr:septation protein SepH [Actinomycetota bacterium]